MCTGKCSKCIGVVLFPLAVCAIISNLLLYFPNGNVTDPDKITDLVWFFHGILGAGILVREKFCHCCCCFNYFNFLKLINMLLSVLLAVLGAAGGVYCVVISSLGLISGPLCDTGDGDYIYPFRNDTLTICKKPENVIMWNIVLFSLLLGIGTIEAVLCFIQVINGLIGFICEMCSCCTVTCMNVLLVY
uniref:Uncharacterized protein n=1 Tax=Chelonoidis abingdonii TaxID=106734 RepID=A0A8C0H1K8_CHEAB